MLADESAGRTGRKVQIVEPTQQLTPAVRLNLEQILERDETQLGAVFRAVRSTGEESPTALAELGVAANVGAVSNLQAILRIILEGEIPAAVSIARASLGRIRRIRKHNAIEDEGARYLDMLVAHLDRVVSDPVKEAAETSDLLDRGASLEKRSEGRAGIYVYTYPHYYKYPYDTENDLYLMKVGRSIDAETRPTRQASVTAAPEEVLILKVYIDLGDRDLAKLEQTFHRLIDAAGHPRSRQNQRREWFATRGEFLDEIAVALNLVEVSET